MAEFLQLMGTVVPIILAVLIDGHQTRTRVAVLEARQNDDRDEFHYHRADSRAHWAVPSPPEPKRR